MLSVLTSPNFGYILLDRPRHFKFQLTIYFIPILFYSFFKIFKDFYEKNCVVIGQGLQKAYFNKQRDMNFLYQYSPRKWHLANLCVEFRMLEAVRLKG